MDLRGGWLIVALVTIFVIPAVVFVVVPDSGLPIFKWIELPALEHTLGFTCGHVSRRVAGERMSLFSITSVTPGKPFWNAGIRAGDVPAGYGGESDFLWTLSWIKRSGSVEFHIRSADESRQTGWSEVKTVTVTYPNLSGRRVP
jgi:hypothetical protein